MTACQPNNHLCHFVRELPRHPQGCSTYIEVSRVTEHVIGDYPRSGTCTERHFTVTRKSSFRGGIDGNVSYTNYQQAPSVDSVAFRGLVIGAVYDLSSPALQSVPSEESHGVL